MRFYTIKKKEEGCVCTTHYSEDRFFSVLEMFGSLEYVIVDKIKNCCDSFRYEFMFDDERYEITEEFINT